MPSCLFQHHFLLALSKAGAQLKSNCQEVQTNENQKAFNIDSQIPLMTATLENILQIDINEYSLDWSYFRKALIDHLNDTKSMAEANKSEKQKTCGSSISCDLTNSFCNKLLAMFDEMRIQIEQPMFSKHGDLPSAQYTSNDYNQSPYLNQLINIALEYRFNKIQGKVVTNSDDYTEKHKDKWLLLRKSIQLWEHKQKNPVPEELRKMDMLGFLNQLVLEESNIQNERKSVSQSTYLSMFKSYVKTGLTMFLEESGALGRSLHRLRDDYSRTSDFIITTSHSEYEEENTQSIYTPS